MGLKKMATQEAREVINATCPAVSKGAVKALWELPRANDPPEVKQDFYRLPYPNDAARDAAGKVDFSRHPKDPAPPFGFDAPNRLREPINLSEG